MTADRIEIRALRADAIHGVLDRERVAAQPFEVDVDVGVDMRAAAASDDIADAVDYALVVGRVLGVLAGPPRQLLERLASEVAEAVLALPGVTEVTVDLRKLAPPLDADVASAGVRLTRARSAGPAGAP